MVDVLLARAQGPRFSANLNRPLLMLHPPVVALLYHVRGDMVAGQEILGLGYLQQQRYDVHEIFCSLLLLLLLLLLAVTCSRASVLGQVIGTNKHNVHVRRYGSQTGPQGACIALWQFQCMHTFVPVLKGLLGLPTTASTAHQSTS